MFKDEPQPPPESTGIGSQILVAVIVELIGGIIREVVIPKIKRYFGEEDKDEKCCCEDCKECSEQSLEA